VWVEEARSRGFEVGSSPAARRALGHWLIWSASEATFEPVPDWVRSELDGWLAAAAIDRGRLFGRVNKVGKAWGEGITEKAVWHIVKEPARTVGVAKLAPHDLRRTCGFAVDRDFADGRFGCWLTDAKKRQNGAQAGIKMHDSESKK
jgi:integrase